jgi:hypothetical protein
LGRNPPTALSISLKGTAGAYPTSFGRFGPPGSRLPTGKSGDQSAQRLRVNRMPRAENVVIARFNPPIHGSRFDFIHFKVISGAFGRSSCAVENWNFSLLLWFS